MSYFSKAPEGATTFETINGLVPRGKEVSPERLERLEDMMSWTIHELQRGNPRAHFEDIFDSYRTEDEIAARARSQAMLDASHDQID
jgi:hypothetical protein